MSTDKPTLGHKVRFYLSVTLIAVMVWVVAEGQTLQRQAVEMKVGFGSNQQYAASVQTEGWTGSVKVTFEGSANVSTEAQGLNGDLLVVEPGQGTVPIETGVHSVDLRQLIREMLETRRSALSVVSVEPATVAVRVQQLERIEQDVVVVLPDGIAASNLVVTPAKVALLVPVGSLTGTVEARVVLDAASLAGQPLGRPISLGERAVTLSNSDSAPLPQGLVVTPASVSVALELQTRAAQVTLASIPIVVQLPPTELNRWNVEIPDSDRVLRDVTLTGPATVIEEYRNGQRQLLAVIRLGFEELETRIESKRAEFPGLGVGVTVEVQDREVGLTITPREAAAPGGG